MGGDGVIACAGVTVTPGDIIAGDGDGVIVIPAHLAMEVAQDAAEQELQEEFAVELVAKGESVDGLYPLGKRWQPAYAGLAGGRGGRQARGARRRAGRPMRFRSDPADPRVDRAGGLAVHRRRRPDTEGLRGLIRWQLESGTHGISLGGSTGEPSAQRRGARRRDAGRRRTRSPTGCRSCPAPARPSWMRRSS